MCENIFTSLQLTHMNDLRPSKLHNNAPRALSSDTVSMYYYVLAIFNGFYFNFSTVKNDSIVHCHVCVCVCVFECTMNYVNK